MYTLNHKLYPFVVPHYVNFLAGVGKCLALLMLELNYEEKRVNFFFMAGVGAAVISHPRRLLLPSPQYFRLVCILSTFKVKVAG
jgi:hypothetical protein